MEKELADIIETRELPLSPVQPISLLFSLAIAGSRLFFFLA
jgi:hypothetical protein